MIVKIGLVKFTKNGLVWTNVQTNLKGVEEKYQRPKDNNPQ